MPRITCVYCRVQYGHEWWCWFKRITTRKRSWNKPAKSVPLIYFDEIRKLNIEIQKRKTNDFIEMFVQNQLNQTIGCYICGRHVNLQYPKQQPSHYWWCRLKRIRIWLIGE